MNEKCRKCDDNLDVSIRGCCPMCCDALIEQLRTALALGYNHVDAYGLVSGDGGLLDTQRIEAQDRFFELAKAALKAADVT